MLRISNVTAVTVDNGRRVIDDAVIVIDGNRLVAVGPRNEFEEKYSDTRSLDGQGMVAIPGLIDTHAHADQALLRGLGDCMHWMPFLDDVIDPYLEKRDPRDAVLANTLAMMEMLCAGTTCFVSPNVDPRDDYAMLTGTVADLGIRAVLGRFISPADGKDSAARAGRSVASATEIMQRWHQQAGLVHFWFGLDVPRRPGDLAYPEFYKAVANAAREVGVGIVYHFCSEIEDAAWIEETFGCRPAEWSRDNHALGSNVLLINGCQVTPPEIDILAETETHLAHSPVANMKMATGVLPLTDVLAAGVNVSLGTDGALNNNSHDMFAEMKTACLLQNSVQRSATAMTAETALEMATINGARAIGRGDELGSLESGKRADIVLVDMHKPNSIPVHDVIYNLVFSCNGSNVHTVFVDGKKVVENGSVTGVDGQQVLAEADRRAAAVRQELDLSAQKRWPIG